MDMHAYPSICLHIHRYACISIDVHDVSRCIRIMHYLRGGVTPPCCCCSTGLPAGGVYPPRIMHALCITWGGYTPPWQAWGYLIGVKGVRISKTPEPNETVSSTLCSLFLKHVSVSRSFSSPMYWLRNAPELAEAEPLVVLRWQYLYVPLDRHVQTRK